MEGHATCIHILAYIRSVFVEFNKSVYYNVTYCNEIICHTGAIVALTSTGIVELFLTYGIVAHTNLNHVMTFSLAVEARKERGKQLAALRTAGKLPAVMYGPKETAVPLSVDRVAFEKLLKDAGESSIITLTGLDTPKDVLVQEVSFDPVRGGTIHVDFYAVEAGKEITVHVPLTFVGEAPGLKQGGTLTKVLHEIEVTCVPANLPQHIDVDLALLTTQDAQIHVRDLTLPAGVSIENDPEDVVALIQAVEEDTGEAPAAIDMSAIEVEKKGKTEEAEETA
jgi:large subunit ribosomal protein L25